MFKIEPLDAAALAEIGKLRASAVISHSEAREMLGCRPEVKAPTVGSIRLTIEADTSPLRRELKILRRDLRGLERRRRRLG